MPAQATEAIQKISDSPSPSHGQPRWAASLLIGVSIILLIVPTLLCANFIRRYGVDIPFWDEWNFVNAILYKFYAGTLTFADILAVKSNEHKLGMSFAVMLAVSVCTHFNCVTNMFVGLAFWAATQTVLITAAVRKLGTRPLTFLAMIPLAVMLCSFRQWQNLLEGMQICVYATCFLFVTTTFLLERANKTIAFATAIVCSILCSYGQLNGMLIWPIGLFQLLLTAQLTQQPERATFYKRAATWAAISIAMAIAYFAQWDWCPGVTGHFNFTLLIRHTFYTIRFALALLGNPYAQDETPAVACGLMQIAMVGALVFLLKQHKSKIFDKSLIAPAMMLLFWILSVGMIFIGRAGMGIEMALASRYSTLGYIGFAGFYLLLLYSNPRAQSLKTFLLGTVTSFIALSIFFTIGPSLEKSAQERALRNTDAAILRAYKTEPDEKLANLFMDTALVRRVAPFLEKRRLTMFAPSNSKP